MAPAPPALEKHLGVELVDVERAFAEDERFELVEDQVLDARGPVGLPDAEMPASVSILFRFQSQVPRMIMHLTSVIFTFLRGPWTSVRYGSAKSAEPAAPAARDFKKALRVLSMVGPSGNFQERDGEAGWKRLPFAGSLFCGL